MRKETKATIRDIKSLTIQGARNVAKAAIKALRDEVRGSKGRDAGSLLKELKAVSEELADSRPTEPMMRNMLRKAETLAESELKRMTLAKAKRAIVAGYGDMLRDADRDADRIAEYGAKLIPPGALVLTHCHSSSVTRILIKAKRMRKRFSVVCFETRPRFQGRKTAAELAEAGIDVTLAVDGAMELFMKKADIILVGADSITSRGDLINKIGTSALAHIARVNDVSLYCAAELYKYSPKTIFGTLEKIEERDPKEVWERAPRKVKIRNPAFEATSSKYINGYITEAGVIPPQSFFAMATEKLGIRIYE